MTADRPPAEPLLDIEDLHITYRSRGGELDAVREVDLTVGRGEIVALVGESGSGKSTTAHAVVGLLPAAGTLRGGRIGFAGADLARVDERHLRSVRGRRIGLVPQDPTVSLNPVQRIGPQVAEVLLIHGLVPEKRAAHARAVQLLAQAGLPESEESARRYPHQLSGGMRQRVLIAIALAAEPQLVLADEPTSALDVTVQRQILDHLESLTAELGTAVLLITHDLGVAADRATRLCVMSQGRIVERGPTRQLLQDPQHPYTRRLLAASAHLSGAVPHGTTAPPATTPPHAHAGVPRTPRDAPPVAAAGVQTQHAPVQGPLLTADRLSKDFPLPGGSGRGSSSRVLRAVDEVSLTVGRGETLALVGESGSGKSTLARMLVRLSDATSGTLTFDGQEITRLRGEEQRRLRRRMQLVYQNPYASLDPRRSLADLVTEPLRAFGLGDRRSRRSRAAELLAQVRLPASALPRRPAELSGGQRQRVALARALAVRPDLVVCDEPVSALDVSVQDQILTLLAELQAELGVSFFFISHDLAVVRQIAHRVGVLRGGRLLEIGATAEVFATPSHPYTRELLDAVPGSRQTTALTA